MSAETTLNNKSNMKSRLRLTRPAFVELAQHGLALANNIKIKAKGVDLVIHSIELKRTSWSLEGIAQELVLTLTAERAQRWMPFRAESELDINLTWKLTSIDGYPAIVIQDMQVSNRKRSKLGVLNLNIGIPRVLERKLFHEIHERIPEIEQVANRQIRKTCNQYFSKVYGILGSDDKSIDHPKVKLEKWLWDANIAQNELIVDFNVTFQTAWKHVKFTPFQFHVNQRELPSDKKSKLILPLPFDEIYRKAHQIEVPIGKLGKSQVKELKLTALSDTKGITSFKLIGDVSADVQLNVQISNEMTPRIVLSELNLTLENKLLDFGASLFENKIQRALQHQLDEQLKHQFDHLEILLNEYLTDLRKHIFIQERPIALNDFKIRAIFRNEALWFLLDSDYFSQIAVESLPDFIINALT